MDTQSFSKEVPAWILRCGKSVCRKFGWGRGALPPVSITHAHLKQQITLGTRIVTAIAFHCSRPTGARKNIAPTLLLLSLTLGLLEIGYLRFALLLWEPFLTFLLLQERIQHLVPAPLGTLAVGRGLLLLLLRGSLQHPLLTHFPPKVPYLFFLGCSIGLFSVDTVNNLNVTVRRLMSSRTLFFHQLHWPLHVVHVESPRGRVPTSFGWFNWVIAPLVTHLGNHPSRSQTDPEWSVVVVWTSAIGWVLRWPATRWCARFASEMYWRWRRTWRALLDRTSPSVRHWSRRVVVVKFAVDTGKALSASYLLLQRGLRAWRLQVDSQRLAERVFGGWSWSGSGRGFRQRADTVTASLFVQNSRRGRWIQVQTALRSDDAFFPSVRRKRLWGRIVRVPQDQGAIFLFMNAELSAWEERT